MKSLVLIAALAAAAAGVSCGGDSAKENPSAATEPAPPPAPSGPTTSPAGTKQTWIYFTKNHNKGTAPGQYNTDCVGIIGTERIGARTGTTTAMGTKIMWHVKVNNGGNDDDKCESLNMSDVNLRFKTDVMGAAAMKKLTANPGGVIEGTVSSDPLDVGSLIAHKYQVYIGDTPAGPDPVIIVNCSTCGPPPS
ncbi:MAG: hypothetical protein ACRD3G_01170 [Vicinamibacterales bacterium]